MQTYKEYSPTSFDPAGLNLPDQQDWAVLPCGLNRDSGCLDQSNFATAVTALGGESDTVEVHRFGHWACGWFEIIIVKPDTPQFALAEEIENSLADYPILDDSDFSEREWDMVTEYWTGMSVRERAEYCGRCDISIFAARRDALPEDDNGSLFQLLRQD